MNTVEISKMQNKFEEFMEQYNQRPTKVILYGAGKGAEWTIALLETKNIVPMAIVDKKCIGGGIRRVYLSYPTRI